MHMPRIVGPAFMARLRLPGRLSCSALGGAILAGGGANQKKARRSWTEDGAQKEICAGSGLALQPWLKLANGCLGQGLGHGAHLDLDDP
jgi:hypothetical protein